MATWKAQLFSPVRWSIAFLDFDAGTALHIRRSCISRRWRFGLM